MIINSIIILIKQHNNEDDENISDLLLSTGGKDRSRRALNDVEESVFVVSAWVVMVESLTEGRKDSTEQIVELTTIELMTVDTAWKALPLWNIKKWRVHSIALETTHFPLNNLKIQAWYWLLTKIPENLWTPKKNILISRIWPLNRRFYTTLRSRIEMVMRFHSISYPPP